MELNYLYCAIVWKNGFEMFTDKELFGDDFKLSFFRIIETTILEIFNYKTYFQSIKLT